MVRTKQVKRYRRLTPEEVTERYHARRLAEQARLRGGSNHTNAQWREFVVAHIDPDDIKQTKMGHGYVSQETFMDAIDAAALTTEEEIGYYREGDQGVAPPKTDEEMEFLNAQLADETLTWEDFLDNKARCPGYAELRDQNFIAVDPTINRPRGRPGR